MCVCVCVFETLFYLIFIKSKYSKNVLPDELINGRRINNMCNNNMSKKPFDLRRRRMYFELYLTAIKGEVSKKKKKV